jgi:hypothetical protein
MLHSCQAVCIYTGLTQESSKMLRRWFWSNKVID